MKRSEQIDKLAEALADAQGEMQNATKDANNPFFKSRYADLAAIRNAARKPLSMNGLAITQTFTATKTGTVKEQKTNRNGEAYGETTYDVGDVLVTTLLMHSSGQWIETELTVPCKVFDAQGIGSASTYGRRYAYQGIIGIASEDEEDDGEAAVGRPATGHQQAPQNHQQRPATPPAKDPSKDVAKAKEDLAEAAVQGMASLEAVWKSLTNEMRRAVMGDMPALKAKAQETDDVLASQQEEAAHA